jgi:hypothetical protein
VIFETDGFISHILGINNILAKWTFSGCMVVFCAVAFFIMLGKKSAKEITVFYYPLLAFGIFFVVSFSSASFLFPKSVKDWLPSLYVFAPIFIFYFLYVFKYTSKEVLTAIISVAIFISILLFMDRLFQFAFLDDFTRRSAFFSTDIRRVVLLKNEVIFGFVGVVSLIVTNNKKLINNKMLLGIASILFLVQALIMESRLGFMAMVVACITLMYLKGITKKTIKLYLAALSIVVVIFPMLFAKHIESLTNMKMDDSESNISIRFETVEYFYNVFLKTYGVGIGMMSSNGRVNNVLHPFGHYNITDAGAYSALLQFGVLGLIMWIFYTFKCLQTYKNYYSKTGKHDAYSAASFAFVIGFTFNLLPFSFFTAYTSISLGGILLYLMWFYRSKIINNKEMLR